MTDSTLAVRQTDFENQMPKQVYEGALNFAEAQAEAERIAGVEYATVVLNPYAPLNQDKSPLVDRPFVIRHVRFQTDKVTGANYLNMWVVRDDDALFRVTDGSTGIYAQMTQLVEERLDSDHPTPYDGFIVANGLRFSEYGLDKNNKAVDLGDKTAVSKGTTYYLN